MKWRRIVPACITLTILLLGFLSILRSAAGLYGAAAQLLVLAAILDGLDGEVARLFRGVTTFGARLDAYVDCIVFGVAPAVMVYEAFWKEFGFWGLVFASAMVVSGVLRFARYQYKDSRVGVHTFRGLPIPVSAVWVSMIVLLTESNLLTSGRFFLDQNAVALLMWVCTMAFLILQVSNVRYAKPTKEMIAWALAATFAVMIILRNPKLGFCLGTCMSMLLFAFAVPAYFHGRLPEKELETEEEEQPVKLRR